MAFLYVSVFIRSQRSQCAFDVHGDPLGSCLPSLSVFVFSISLCQALTPKFPSLHYLTALSSGRTLLWIDACIQIEVGRWAYFGEFWEWRLSFKMRCVIYVVRLVDNASEMIQITRIHRSPTGLGFYASFSVENDCRKWQGKAKWN